MSDTSRVSKTNTLQSNDSNEENSMQSRQSPILLASSSRYRASLLNKLNISFECYSPNINETPRVNESPLQVVTRLSFQKALSAQKQFPKHLIIASDQVAYIKEEQTTLSSRQMDIRLLTKPLTLSNAEKQLTACSGKTVQFLTGLCCLPTLQSIMDSDIGAIDASNRAMVDKYCEVAFVDVTFRNLSQGEIRSYLEQELPLDCAGSFKAEGLGIALFEKLESTDPNTIIGLPLIALSKRLRDLGINPLLGK